ncbi:MAG: hypothetical protein NTY38_00955 [Acidobacteria bacterium]|nr:hypothetical protein [Acidobacteriota bacterium]
MNRRTFLAAAASPLAMQPASRPLEIATFRVDVTPRMGDPLCFGLCQPASRIDDPLTARGLILFNAGAPIVLCAFDWVEIAGRGYDLIRNDLAKAAGTSPDRVALHTLHQHDTPGYNPGAEETLAASGIPNELYGVEMVADARRRLARAVSSAARNRQPVTHLGIGRGKVDRVASNRRVLGPDGKVQYQRQSSCKLPEAIAAPEGTIDPYVALLTDFVGAARRQREAALPGVVHIHFDGASGNIAAGKYNTGAPENRPVLAGRLAEGMKQAWDATRKAPLSAGQVRWKTLPVSLPLSPRLQKEKLLAELRDTSHAMKQRTRAARDLSWVRLMEESRQTPLQLLDFGPAAVLHMPGELFVEYQLAAQVMRKDKTIAMAAYGDCGPGYIGTRISYSQGGYETGEVSMVAPEVEDVLMNAMRKLLA